MPTLELALGPKREGSAFWMRTVGAERVNDVESVNHKLVFFRTPIQHLTINAR